MGDYTALQIAIYDCPEHEVATVMGILENYGLDEGWDVRSSSSLSELRLGEEYVVNDAPCGSSDDLAAALTAAPGTSYEVWEDPKYEWLGSLNRYTPTLDHWGAECDANGQPQFEVDQILRWVDEAEGLADLKVKLGVPWREALDALAEANKDKVVSPPAIELHLAIENHYSGDVVKTEADVTVPPVPTDEDEQEEWRDEHIFPLTGTGASNKDSAYFVTVTFSSRPDLIPVDTKWEFGL